MGRSLRFFGKKDPETSSRKKRAGEGEVGREGEREGFGAAKRAVNGIAVHSALL